MDVKSREIFPLDVGHEAKLQGLWAHHISSIGQVATLSATQRNEGEDDVVESGDINLDRREHTQADIQGQAESYIFGFKNEDDFGEVGLDFFYALMSTEGFSEQ